jgi:hypothetical protein
VEKARGKRDVAPRPFSTRPRAVLWSRQPDPRTCSGTTTAHHLLSPLFLPPVDSMDSTTNGRHLGEALFSSFLHARTRTHNKIAPRFQTSPTGTHTHSPAPVPALCSLPPSPNFGEVEKVSDASRGPSPEPLGKVLPSEAPAPMQQHSLPRMREEKMKMYYERRCTVSNKTLFPPPQTHIVLITPPAVASQAPRSPPPLRPHPPCRPWCGGDGPPRR